MAAAVAPNTETIRLADGNTINVLRPSNVDEETWAGVKKYITDDPARAVHAQNAIKEITSSKEKMAQFQAMSQQIGQMKGTPQGEKTLEILRNDPEFAAKFAEIERQGFPALHKYYNDEAFLRALSKKAGGPPQNNLTECVRTGSVAAVQQMLNSRCSPSQPDARGITPLHMAVGINRVDLVTLLLQNQANPHAVDAQGSTILHYAAGYGRDGLVNQIIGMGLNINQVNKQGFTALDLAVQNGHRGTQDLLRARGARSGSGH